MSTDIMVKVNTNCNQIFQTRNTSHNKAKVYSRFQDVVQVLRSFPGDASGKEPHLPMQETRDTARSVGQKDCPGGGHSNSLQYSPGESHKLRSLTGQSIGSQRVRHD